MEISTQQCPGPIKLNINQGEIVLDSVDTVYPVGESCHLADYSLNARI